MSLMYSDSKVKTKYLDPRNHDNYRTEFRLDYDAFGYLPNMKLTNLGAVVSAKHGYNELAGAYSLIKNIYLYDGKTELSSLRNVPQWLGFKNANNENSDNLNYESYVSCSALGLEQNDNPSKITRDRPVLDADITDNGQATDTKKATLNLDEVFPILGAVNSLHTDIFKNLRVVIEYNTASNLMFNRDNLTWTISKPLMVVDCIHDEGVANKLKQRMGNVAWLEIEHDEFNLAQRGVGGGAENIEHQNVEKVNGFNNKRLERVAIIKQYVNPQQGFDGANTNLGYGALASPADFRFKLQIRVNGQNIFPRNGIEGDNERLALLCDTWGDFSVYPFCNTVAVSVGSMDTLITNGVKKIGNMDFTGAYIGKKVEDLQFIYKRTTKQDNNVVPAVPPASAQKRIHIYAEVRKQMMVQNGQYNIVYV